MTDKKKEAPELHVVTQLPTEEQRNLTDADGKEHEFETVEEALTKLRKDVEQIKKSVA